MIDKRCVAIQFGGLLLAGSLAYAVLMWTGRTTGLAGIFLIAVLAISHTLGLRQGLIAAGLSFPWINIIHAPDRAFSIPTVNEVVVYVVILISAWIVGRSHDRIVALDKPVILRPPSRSGSALPFTGGTSKSFWQVMPSGDWIADCEVGAAYAAIYARHVKENSGIPLCWIVQDMIKSGRYTGIEAGFMGEINRQLRPLCGGDDDAPYLRLYGRVVEAHGEVGTGLVGDEHTGQQKLA